MFNWITIVIIVMDRNSLKFLFMEVIKNILVKSSPESSVFTFGEKTLLFLTSQLFIWPNSNHALAEKDYYNKTRYHSCNHTVAGIISELYTLSPFLKDFCTS